MSVFEIGDMQKIISYQEEVSTSQFLRCVVATMYYRPSRKIYLNLINYRPTRQKYLVILSFLITTLIMSILFSTTSRYVSPEVHEFQQGLQPSKILERTRKCSRYMSRLRHLILPNHNTSADFSQTTFQLKEEKGQASRLALSFVVHGQPGLFEILLHLMFRPWHSYCIYIDAKTREKTRKAFQSIVNCYQEIFPWTNIFLVQSPERISWGTYSLLNADLTCLEQLLSVDKTWEYYLNLAGSELPLLNIDDYAKRLKNSSIPYSIVSFFEPNLQEDRMHYSIKEIETTKPASQSFSSFFPSQQRYHSYERTMNLKSPAPFNLTVYKGWKNVVLSRNFSAFALTHPISKTFREWTKDMEIPDEEFFATLARITSVKKTQVGPSSNNDDYKKGGNYIVEQTHVKELPIKRGLCPRITLWDTNEDYQCYGKTIRNICHISSRDLDFVMQKNSLDDDDDVGQEGEEKQQHLKQDCLVANKFNLEVDAEPILSLARYLSPFVLESSNLHFKADLAVDQEEEKKKRRAEQFD